jgi:hypothetical protein
MKRHQQGWEAWEFRVNKDLGLDPTISSGNKWHDPGDGVDRSHYTEEFFPLVVDAKYTESASFTVSQQTLFQWVKKAEEMGKRFLLAVRICPKGHIDPEDYVVVPYNDFVEFREAYKDLKLRKNAGLNDNDIEFLEMLAAKMMQVQLRLKMISVVNKLKGSADVVSDAP